MRHALKGGLWFHRHTYKGEPMAHLVSSDRDLLLQIGPQLGLEPSWLQFKPLKKPDTGERVLAWHWDLRGESLKRGLSGVAQGVAHGSAGG